MRFLIIPLIWVLLRYESKHRYLIKSDFWRTFMETYNTPIVRGVLEIIILIEVVLFLFGAFVMSGIANFI